MAPLTKNYRFRPKAVFGNFCTADFSLEPFSVTTPLNQETLFYRFRLKALFGKKLDELMGSWLVADTKRDNRWWIIVFCYILASIDTRTNGFFVQKRVG